jgi:hypothetical protein
MNMNRHQIAFLLVACAFALVTLTCTPSPAPACPSGSSTRTQGCDEFKGWNAQVLKNSSGFTLAGWHPLTSGDELSSDNTGEAELNLSACWAGRIYIFKNSGGQFRVAQCRRAAYTTSSSCIPFGTWYVGACAGEFSLSTGSAKVTKTGTSFSATFLPENREVTLVVVLEGRVSVEPVESFDPTQLGPASDVAEGQFYFTMPDAVLSDIAGLEPRTAHPLEDLPRVADELGILDWMFEVREKADEDGVLPGNWPQELGGQTPSPEPPPPTEGFVVVSDGGVFADPRVQEAVIRGVDWSVAGGGEDVTAVVDEQPLNAVDDLAYDPDLALALLEEAGVGEGQPFWIAYPVEDPQLAEAAEAAAEYLRGLGIIAVRTDAVPFDELEEVTGRAIESGRPVVLLIRLP